MIKANIKGKEYDIPTSWWDVPYNKALEVIKLDNSVDILCVLIGITPEEVDSLQSNSVNQLLNCLSFVNDIEEVTNNKEPEERFKKFDYGTAPFGDTEAVRNIMKSNSEKSFLFVADKVILKLTGIDISNDPFAQVIGSVDFFLTQWVSFMISTQNSVKESQVKTNKLLESDGSNNSGVLELM